MAVMCFDCLCQVVTMEELRKKILSQAAAERAAQFEAVCTKDADIIANSACPADDLTPWENLIQSAKERSLYGVVEEKTFLYNPTGGKAIKKPLHDADAQTGEQREDAPQEKLNAEGKPVDKFIFACLDRNELGDGELFQTLHKNDFCFDTSLKLWRRFTGVVWEQDSLAESRRAVVELAPLYEDAGKRRIGYYNDKIANINIELNKTEANLKALTASEADSDAIAEAKKEVREVLVLLTEYQAKKKAVKKKVDDRARQLRGVDRSRKALDMAAIGTNSCAVPADVWDRYETLFAFQNGIVDLETGRIMRSKPSLYLSRKSEYEYLGLHHYSAWWDDHLHKIFCGKEELIDFFEYAIGNSMVGMQINKHFYAAHGPHANNGKSATFNAIMKVMGEYATPLKLEVLLEDKQRSKGPDPELMVLDNVRMVVASEAPANVSFAMDKLKMVTGADPVRARGMYTDSKVLTTNCTLWLHTNDVPQVSGYDPGFMLRLKLIPFDAQFVAAEEACPEEHKYAQLNKFDLDKKLTAAYPAIGSWLVRCARKFLHNMDFPIPEIIKNYSKEYFEEQDIVGFFLNDACIANHDATIQSQKLWLTFKQWCIDVQGIKEKFVMKNRTFSQNLMKRNAARRVKTNPVVIMGGIELKPEWDGKEYKES